MANNAGAITTRRILACKDFADIINTAEFVQTARSWAQPLLLNCRVKEGEKFIKLSIVRKMTVEPYVDPKGCTDELDNEIKIINLLQQKIVRTKISPCIVELEGSCRYDIFEVVAALNLDCTRLGRRLISRAPRSLAPREQIHWTLCEWRHLVNIQEIKPSIVVEIMERCDMGFVAYLSTYHDTYVEFMILKSMFFMVIYTLYQIQKMYPGFHHYDLHTDNVMIKIDRDFVFDPSKPTFLVFNDDKVGKFTIPYYGIMPRIIDFGFSVIPEENICPIASRDETFMKSRWKHDLGLFMLHAYDDLGRYHTRVANFLATIDPELVHTEAMFTALEHQDKTLSTAEILRLSVWDEFRNVKIKPEQIHDEYNSPPKTK